MFRDIVSTLSLSPSATSQLTFYWRRLKGEQLTRQLSIVMAIALAALQVATVVAPPDSANASSGGSMIDGGISPRTKSAVINTYTSNTKWREALNRFGVRKVDLENASVGTLNISNHSLISFGTNPNPYDINSYTIDGVKYYARPLWRNALQSTFQVLEGRRHGDNKYFAVMFDCGNLVVTDLTPSTETIEIIGGSGNVPPAPTPTAPAPSAPSAPAAPAAPVTDTAPIPPEIPQTNIPTATAQPVNTPTPTAPNIVVHKTGELTTLEGTQVDANGATAQAGELITYTLHTKNTGNATKKDYVITDNVADILEYADITGKGDAVLFDKELRWPKEDINAGQDVTKVFTVKVKDPIPATSISIADPSSFDLKMVNIYNDVITTNLTAPTPAKQVEIASTTLPQTGPGLSTGVVFLLMGAIAYFYFRNRQLITELSILRSDHQGYGGER